MRRTADLADAFWKGKFLPQGSHGHEERKFCLETCFISAKDLSCRESRCILTGTYEGNQEREIDNNAW